MFSFLKDKLKSVVGKFSKKVEEQGKEEVIEISHKEKPKKQIENSSTKPSKDKKSAQKKETSKKSKELKNKNKKNLEDQEEPEESVAEEEIEEGDSEENPNESLSEEEEEKSEPIEKKGFFSRLFSKKDKADEIVQPQASTPSEHSKGETIKVEEEDTQQEASEELQEGKEEKKGFFAKLTEKVTTKKINESQFNELFWDLELALLESNVAVEVIEKIKEDLKLKIVDKPIKKSDIESSIVEALRASIEDVLDVPKLDLLKRIKEKRPFVICFIGINGSGKTTSIAKVANLLQKNKISLCLAAADTFRAAAIQQLEEHANNLNIKLIKHDYGADSASVAFDAVKHAEARHLDAVLIDTAGRLHSNDDLMKEMQKLIRVAKPDLKIFVGESITGNDCVEQAKKFNELIGIDAIILSKADIDEKGGAAISISYVTKKPIIYIGTGQTYDDLKEFNKEEIIKSLGL